MRYLIIILVFIAFTLNGQDRFITRGSSGIYHSIPIKSIRPSPYIAKLQPSLSSGLEFLIQREIRKHWRVSFGLLYEYFKLKYNIAFEPLMEPAFLVAPRVAENFNQTMHSLSTPLYAHYYFGKNERLLVGLGLAHRLEFSTQSNTEFLNSDGTTETLTSNFFDLQYKITAQFEAGYRFLLKNKNELTLTGSIKHNFFNYGTFFFNNSFFYEPLHYQAYLTVGYSFLN